MPPHKTINPADLELILEVNKKTIELEIETSAQNEEILEHLETGSEKLDEILEIVTSKKIEEKIDKSSAISSKDAEKIIKQNEDLSRDLFQVKILFVTGLFSLVVQIINLFKK